MRSQQKVVFRETSDARFPFEAMVDGVRWTVRINEFPEEPSLYSLIVDGEVVEELMDWPPAWTRLQRPTGSPAPVPPGQEDPHEKAEYERELAHAE